MGHAAGQAANGGMSDRIMGDTPIADRYSVAPYIIQSLSPEEVRLLGDDDKLFRWVFAWPLITPRRWPARAWSSAPSRTRGSGLPGPH